MITFKQFLEENRRVDPMKLAQRASRLYGSEQRRPSYKGFYYDDSTDPDMGPPKKHGHLPLFRFNYDDAEAVTNKDHTIKKRHSSSAYEGLKKTRVHRIQDLHPIQPWVDMHDHDILARKLKGTDLGHIRTVTHRGKTYVMDGHHSVMAAKIRGEKYITVDNHIDLDDHAD